MRPFANLFLLSALALVTLTSQPTKAGVIKDIFQKITNTNNKTQDIVKESAPVCGSGIFTTPDEFSLSPEIVFISKHPSRSEFVNDERRRNSKQISEVAEEFTFHAENVTLEELEQHGFNRDAPTTFLIHGFTSGYPQQAWMTGIVEAYTIDRESSERKRNRRDQNYGRETQNGQSYSNGNQNYDRENQPYSNGNTQNYNQNSGRENYGRENKYQGSNDNYNQRQPNNQNSGRESQYSQGSSNNNQNYGNNQQQSTGRGGKVGHNLFAVNWAYAARGILYPRAVANIPIAASYVTKFINEKLLEQARMDPRRFQLIGHSLGAHFAGYVGKNTNSKLGRIYGLDPAGPCFGALSGSLFPSNKRLSPNDAEEVITIHTNTALLGIDKPLGKYSVFVEGGEKQPGCQDGGIRESISTFALGGGDADKVSCSHSRAPNLLTYRLDQSDSENDCQLVAFGCKDWKSFTSGFCGVCESSSGNQGGSSRNENPLDPVTCLRVGLDWQYPGRTGRQSQSQNYQTSNSGYRNQTSSYNNGRDTYNQNSYSNQKYGRENEGGYGQNQRDRDTQNGYNSRDRDNQGGYSGYGNSNSNSNYNNQRENSGQSNSNYGRDYSNGNSNSNSQRRNKRQEMNATRRDNDTSSSSSSSSTVAPSERRLFSSDSSDQSESKVLYLKTGDTQPYCVFQYQVVLELNRPFDKKPAMSLVLQDAEQDSSRSRNNNGRRNRRWIQQNSLTSDNFGTKFSDTIYTELMISGRKLARVDHATLLFRGGLQDGSRYLKAIHVNYMSHIDANVRRGLSSRLCLVETSTDRSAEARSGQRYFFEPCR